MRKLIIIALIFCFQIQFLALAQDEPSKESTISWLRHESNKLLKTTGDFTVFRGKNLTTIYFIPKIRKLLACLVNVK